MKVWVCSEKERCISKRAVWRSGWEGSLRCSFHCALRLEWSERIDRYLQKESLQKLFLWRHMLRV